MEEIVAEIVQRISLSVDLLRRPEILDGSPGEGPVSLVWSAGGEDTFIDRFSPDEVSTGGRDYSNVEDACRAIVPELVRMGCARYK